MRDEFKVIHAEGQYYHMQCNWRDAAFFMNPTKRGTPEFCAMLIIADERD
jgi:hypothetical protein